MTYRAQVILDSVSEAGDRLTTMEVCMPRIILAEHGTHRDRERNASSSRAIPFARMKADVLANPFIPEFWWSEQKGMQGGEPIPLELQLLAAEIWTDTLEHVARAASKLHYIGHTYAGLHHIPDYEHIDIRLHKNIPNRLLEPWMWTTVIVSATQWKHFFNLRCHESAEPHFQKVACMMRSALEKSVPVLRDVHMPYVTNNDENQLRDEGHDTRSLMAISTARCARVSYLTHDGTRDPEKDLDLHGSLESEKHMSPFGHVAIAGAGQCGPFTGWFQYRKAITGEYDAT